MTDLEKALVHLSLWLKENNLERPGETTVKVLLSDRNRAFAADSRMRMELSKAAYITNPSVGPGAVLHGIKIEFAHDREAAGPELNRPFVA